MTEKAERSAFAAKLMAAASVLGLSLGMATQAADAEQLKGTTPQGSTQIKGETDQHKLTTGFLKHNTDLNQGKFTTGDHKNATGQGSNQLKWEGVSGQHKHQIPSTELNPQPEPPKPTNNPQNH